jgi:ribosomal RNA-processing protein 9
VSGTDVTMYRNLSLWTIHKKKPIYTIPASHGLASPPLPENSSAEIDPPQEPPCPPQPRYVTALAIIPYANLIFSGSWDSVIRVWKVTSDKKRIEAVGTIHGEGSVRGVVNGIAVFERGEKDDAEIVVCVGTGKLMRLGNWLQVPGRDGGYIMEIKKKKLGQVAAEEAEDDTEYY